MNDDQVTLINLDTGNRVTVYRDDARFANFSGLVATGDYVSAEALDVKVVVDSFSKSFSVNSGFSVNILDGVGTVQVRGSEYPLSNIIVDRIIKMAEQGFDAMPLVRFMGNLYDNPSKTAIDELFLFLDQSELPITSDGHFIAYKIVGNDYKDLYSQKFDNSVGAVCQMDRFAVDDVRTNTCSAGLHFCSHGYLPHYGNGGAGESRCMLVKINPADVVSIPNDYNNAKGRTCRYEVVGEVEGDDWRAKLSENDFTDQSVVYDYDDEDYDDDDYDGGFCSDLDDDLVPCLDSNTTEGYKFDANVNTWRDSEGHFVSKQTVAAALGVSVLDLENYK
jgi:hypothetical protein